MKTEVVAGIMEENDRLRAEKARILTENVQLREAVEKLAVKVNQLRSMLSDAQKLLSKN